MSFSEETHNTTRFNQPLLANPRICKNTSENMSLNIPSGIILQLHILRHLFNLKITSN